MNIQGWASTHDLDHSGHIVLPSAYSKTIASRGLQGPRGVRLLAYHDKERTIGAITKLEVRNSGLWLEGEIEEGISYAKDLALALKACGGMSFSVGFFLKDADVTDDGVLVIKEVDLFEVSVVPLPANDAAVMVPSRKGGELHALGDQIKQLKRTMERLSRCK